MKSICAVTSTRADFGILLPLLQRLSNDASLELRLAVTGAHLLDAQGNTVQEIMAEGFTPDCRIPIQAAGDTPEAASRTMANALIGFADYFANRRPDLLLVLGDRYEIAAVCCAAVNARIPIAHIHGGETTEGAVDEAYRHAITKMSYLHFTSCEAYRRRVIQLGEARARVFNTGALSVDNFNRASGVSMEALAAFTGLDPLAEKSYAVVTFHPVTLENVPAQAQLAELMAAMDGMPALSYLITGANADAGGEAINALWRAAAAQRENWAFVLSLGMRRYVTAVKNARFLLGNSSSGMIEAPAAGIPTVNIGDRQKGRIRADSVIDCPPERNAILYAMQQAASPDLQAVAASSQNPFGDGHAAARIAAILHETLAAGEIDLKKAFYDIDMGERA